MVPSKSSLFQKEGMLSHELGTNEEDSCFTVCVLNHVIFSVAEDGIASCCNLGGLISTEHLQHGLVNEPAV